MCIIKRQLLIFVFAVVVFHLLLDDRDLLVHVADAVLGLSDLFFNRFDPGSIFFSYALNLIIILLVDIAQNFGVGLLGILDLLLQGSGLFFIRMIE